MTKPRITGTELTERTILNLRAGTKRSDRTALPGGGRLIVRARASRAHVTIREFYFRYYVVDGLDRTVLIGRHGNGTGKLTLKAAREEAWRLSSLLKEGKDPQVQRQLIAEANRAAERQAREAAEREARNGTLADLVAAYVAHLKKQGKASATDTEKTLQLHVLKPFPSLTCRQAREITADDVTDILARMIARGIERRTNIVRSMLRAAFAYGTGLDNDPLRKAEALKTHVRDVAKVFGITANPVADVKRLAQYDRAWDRTLNDDELRHYLSCLDRLHAAIRGALRVSLWLGGQRLTQLLRARWADYDPEECLLRIRDAKGRGKERIHLLPVSERVAAMLAGLKNDHKAGEHPNTDGFIFSTRNGTIPVDLATLSNAVSVIARDFPRQHFPQTDVRRAPYRAADLRRTAETRLAALGVSKEHRAQLLSHGRKSDVQDKHYDRHDYLREKAAALAKWEGHLDAVLRHDPSKVVRGRFGRQTAS